MARSIYLTAIEPGRGKSVVALGMMESLSRLGRVGYFRPIVPSDTAPDNDIELVRRYRLAQTYPESYAATVDNLRAMSDRGQYDTRAQASSGDPAKGGRRGLTDRLGLVPLTVPEVRRLLVPLIWTTPTQPGFVLARSRWRRRHQARARRAHYHRRQTQPGLTGVGSAYLTLPDDRLAALTTLGGGHRPPPRRSRRVVDTDLH